LQTKIRSADYYKTVQSTATLNILCRYKGARITKPPPYPYNPNPQHVQCCCAVHKFRSHLTRWM